MSPLGITIFILFAIFLIWLGTRFGSSAHTDDFHIGTKKVGLLHVIFGIFSVVGAGEFIYTTSLAYSFGLWSVLLFIGFALGCLIFLYFIRTLRKHNELGYRNRIYDVLSIPDHLYVTYNRSRLVSITATVLVLLSLFALLLIQYELGGRMLELITGMPYTISVALMALTVVLYVYAGGFKGVLITDVIQVSVLFVVFILFAFFYTTPGHTPVAILEQTKFLDIGTLGYLLVAGICWVLGGGDIWQRVLSAKSDVVARKSLIWNVVMLSTFGLVIAFIGTKIALNYPGADPNTAFIDMLANLPTSAPWLAVIAAFGLFAALISTADTELLAISTLLNKEVLRTDPKTIQHGLSTQQTKLIVLIVTIVAVMIILFKSISLVSIYFTLLNLFMILGAVAFVSFIGRGRPRAIAGGMILGVFVLIYISFKNLPAANAAYNLLVIVPPLIFGLWQRNNFYQQLEPNVNSQSVQVEAKNEVV